MLNKTIKDYLTAVDSSDEVSSAASIALVGTIAATLAKRCVIDTQKSKRFLSFTNEQREGLEETANKLNTFRDSYKRLLNDSNIAYKTFKQDNNPSIYMNAYYSISLTTIETIIAIDNVKELLNRDVLINLLEAANLLKAIYLNSVEEMKYLLDLVRNEAMSDDMADFLVEKRKIESDIESVIIFCERNI